ncbi:MAG: dCTP deaminase [Candidatus Marinimicrobia bacterium]|nr:dCTP deaminase [Candidatus Neomarinimicrobiota bacterium]
MSVKPDNWIMKMAKEKKMIEPFSESQSGKETISYGVSAYGYDIRLSDEFKIFKGHQDTIIDPKDSNEQDFESFKGKECIIPPNSFVLAKSLEYFRIPKQVITIASGKSTYARCGIIANVTPFEPEWEGFATLSVSNTAPKPAKIYAGEGICQLLFFESDEECGISYADKNGRYQAQKEITHAR